MDTSARSQVNQLHAYFVSHADDDQRRRCEQVLELMDLEDSHLLSFNQYDHPALMDLVDYVIAFAQGFAQMNGAI